MSNLAPTTATSPFQSKENQRAVGNEQPETRAAGTGQAVGRPFSLRGFTSMLLMLCLLGMLLTGIVLSIAPRGRFANWNDWTAISLHRYQWISFHLNASLVFMALSFIHLSMNWSRLATILDLAPIDFPMQMRSRLRDSWEATLTTCV